MKKRIFNLIIVDESGSMACVERQTVNGINETLQTIRNSQKEHPELENVVTLITFSSGHITHIYDNADAEKALDLKPTQYRPNACTPLYDAIGHGIATLKRTMGPTDSALVTILTDGEENSSKEFNHQQIKALIEEQKKLDWVFTFIGANIDVERTSNGLGIDHWMAFEQTSEGTERAWSRSCRLREDLVQCFCAMPDEGERPTMQAAAKKAKFFKDDDK